MNYAKNSKNSNTIFEIRTKWGHLKMWSKGATPTADRQPKRSTVGGTFELNMLDEINQLRANPKSYTEKLKQLLRRYGDEGLYVDPDLYLKRNSKEGKEALQEAIEVLNKTESLPPLRLSLGLSRSCQELVR